MGCAFHTTYNAAKFGRPTRHGLMGCRDDVDICTCTDKPPYIVEKIVMPMAVVKVSLPTEPRCGDSSAAVAPLFRFPEG